VCVCAGGAGAGRVAGVQQDCSQAAQ